MKKIFLIIVVCLCVIIVFYLRQSRASQTLEGLKITTPSLSGHITSAISKSVSQKASALFSLIPARFISKGVWTGLGWGFGALKPQLETTQWAGEQVQKVGKFSIITAGLATATSSSWFFLALFAQIKKFKVLDEQINKLKKEIKELETQKESPAEIGQPKETNKEEIKKNIENKTKNLNELLKQASKKNRFIKIIKKIALPGILTLMGGSLVGQAYGVGYAGDWLRYIGGTLRGWSIPFK